MKARMGAIRTLGLATATTVVAAGLGVLATPSSYAADPTFPSPASSRWVGVAKSAAPLTDDGPVSVRTNGLAHDRKAPR